MGLYLSNCPRRLLAEYNPSSYPALGRFVGDQIALFVQLPAEHTREVRKLP